LGLDSAPEAGFSVPAGLKPAPSFRHDACGVKAVTSLIYLIMAAWLLISAGLRIVLLLRSGSDLDALPFISGSLGLIALVSFLVGDDRPERSRDSGVSSTQQDRG
jgi:hypothetical protein